MKTNGDENQPFSLEQGTLEPLSFEKLHIATRLFLNTLN
jgi:hypothetical protein